MRAPAAIAAYRPVPLPNAEPMAAPPTAPASVPSVAFWPTVGSEAQPARVVRRDDDPSYAVRVQPLDDILESALALR